MTRRGIGRSLLALAIGASAGYLCALLHTPIPWMLGPLFSLAILRVAGVDVGVPTPVRYGGQWIIGTSLGLYFTPPVVREVAGLWYLLAAGAVFAVAVGYASALALARLSGLDRTTALFASVPGGAAEMAVLGERFGARVDRVAAAQSVRILIVVGIIPAVYTLVGVHGADPYVQGAKTFVPMGFVWLMIATAVGGLVFQRFRVPNAFVLGSLAVAIPLTAMEIDLSAMPQIASNIGQCLLGCALGFTLPARLPAGRAPVRRCSGRVGVSGDSIVRRIRDWPRCSVRTASGDAGARYRAGRHRRNVHHGQGPAIGRTAGDRIPGRASHRHTPDHRARVFTNPALVGQGDSPGEN